MKTGPKDMVYTGRDLDAMSFAPNYLRWIYHKLAPHIGKRIVEVGAGVGNFSRLLLDKNPEILVLLEPSPNLLGQLTANTADHRAVTVYSGTLAQFCETLGEANLDTIVYVNVLEHIEDDQEELRLAYDVLQPGGKILIFVPAMQFLYGTFDRAIGHCRRYSRSEMLETLQNAGFRSRSCRYFDSAGIVPWFVAFRILRLQGLSIGMASGYDKIVVPVLRRIENGFRLPFGKNIVAIGEKE